MGSFCLDASSVIPLLLPLPSSRRVRPFWEQVGDVELVAPPLLFAEVTSVVRRCVHAGAVQHDEAAMAIGDLFALVIRVVHDAAVYLKALDMARQLRHGKAYDVQYLAVAEMENCPIVTADRALHASALALGIESRLLA